MPVGTDNYKGLAVPLYGQSEIKKQTAATDLLTLTAAATNDSGDLLVLRDSAGTEKFSMGVSNFTRKLVMGTVALASLASNASEATVAATGLTTGHVVQIFAAASGPLPNVYVAAADQLGYGPASRASAAMTVNFLAWLTA